MGEDLLLHHGDLWWQLQRTSRCPRLRLLWQRLLLLLLLLLLLHLLLLLLLLQQVLLLGAQAGSCVSLRATKAGAACSNAS